MGKADFSYDHLGRDLAAGFVLLDRAERLGGLGAGESEALADGVLKCMNGALLKVSESLEAQTQLRQELRLVQEEFRQQRVVQAERIQSLESELQAVRQDLAAERVRVQQVLATLQPERPCCPPDVYLRRPLVLRSAQGAFLGVADRGGLALSLAGFLRLVEGVGHGLRGGAAQRTVASCWENAGADWSLALAISGRYSSRQYILETQALRTPIGNEVTLLASMQVDGRAVPQDYVVQMFRQLRENLQEQ